MKTLAKSIILLGVATMAARIEEAIHFAGPVTMGSTFTPPSGSIGDVSIASGANIKASKLQAQHQKLVQQGFPATTVADAETLEVIPVADGNLDRFYLAVEVECSGNATIVCHLEDNGVMIPNSQITIDENVAAREYVLAPLGATVAIDANSRITLVVDATVGTGVLGKGLYGIIAWHNIVGF